MWDFDLIDLIIESTQDEDFWEPEPLYTDLEYPFYDEEDEDEEEDEKRVIILDI